MQRSRVTNFKRTLILLLSKFGQSEIIPIGPPGVELQLHDISIWIKIVSEWLLVKGTPGHNVLILICTVCFGEIHFSLNAIWSSDAIWRRRSGSLSYPICLRSIPYVTGVFRAYRRDIHHMHMHEGYIRPRLPFDTITQRCTADMLNTSNNEQNAAVLQTIFSNAFSYKKLCFS